MGVSTHVNFDPGGVHISGEDLQIPRAIQYFSRSRLYILWPHVKFADEI